jgi:hypothetical protein
LQSREQRPSRPGFNAVLTALLPRRITLAAMTDDKVAYHGEVWTDARGYASVRLPVDVPELGPPLKYELRDLEPSSTARITRALRDGQFAIATDQPHVKVAWRLTGRRPHRQQEEE